MKQLNVYNKQIRKQIQTRGLILCSTYITLNAIGSEKNKFKNQPLRFSEEFGINLRISYF